MKCYLKELIHPGQNTFINSKLIGDNITHFFVISITAAIEIPESIFTAHFFKAFDSLN